MLQPQIDYRRVSALPYRKTIAYFNNFIINTTQFLNRFSYLCERKLNEVANNIQRLEITLQLLEVKLASIPGLEAHAPQPQANGAPNVEIEGGAPPPPPPPPGPGARAPVAAPVEDEEPPASNGMTMKEDPRYNKYFKMLKLGVAIPQIQQKMMMEGIRPEILDTPDAPSDYKAEAVSEKGEKSDEDSDDDFE